jgi:hypothetical protein
MVCRMASFRAIFSGKITLKRTSATIPPTTTLKIQMEPSPMRRRIIGMHLRRV